MGQADRLARFHEELVAIARSTRAALGAGDRDRLEGLSSRLDSIAGRARLAGLAEVERWASALRERTAEEPATP